MKTNHRSAARHSAFRIPHSALSSRRPFLERLEERTVLSSFAASFGGAAEDYANPTHAVDPAGNNYLTGAFSSQPADFDPGPGAANLISAGAADAFVAKYTADGSLAWARRFGGIGSDIGQQATYSLEGGTPYVYVAGTFSGSADFGPGVGVLTSAGGYDIFILKLDAATGSTIWGERIGGAGADGAYLDLQTADGQLYVTGDFSGTVDFDPGAAIINKTSAGNQDGFVLVLNASGNYVTAWQFGGTAYDSPRNLVVDQDAVYVRGNFWGTADFDPGPGIESRTPSGVSNWFLAKYSPSGLLAWVQDVEIDSAAWGAMAQGDASLYVVSDFANAGDADPGPGITPVSAAVRDAIVASYSKADGSLQWAQSFGGSAADSAASVSVDASTGMLYIGGYFSSLVDFNSAAAGGEVASAGGYDGYILQLEASTGDYQNVWTVSGTGTDISLVNGAYYGIVNVSGRFQNSATFPTGEVRATAGGTDGFVMSLDQADPLPPPAPSTKFYVADDGTTNKTFEYAANGASIENYTINSGNSAPRGAASTIAGDKVWVADANKNVYIYNTSGGLLGSWSAGSLAANADVQGITTNGTDVWIVDAKQDKVFKYTGAASRLSGTQTAASSFSLSSSNAAPTDLVTDGTSIWVLNNSTTDKIFKYTVSGTLQGSWTISSAGGNPTGLTIDPASVSSIWIVDSSTDRIYEFASATSRTSGSAAPTTSFPLASTNTNPQGLADPPPAVGSVPSGGTSDFSYDAALLGIVSELESLLSPSGKKRG